MRRLALLLALAIALPAPLGAEPERARIVVLQRLTLRPFELALKGLREELGAERGVRVERVDLERADLAEHIRSLEPDVVVPLGSKVTAWAIEHTDDVPIVFGMVLNPVSSGLVSSMQRPGGRVTGASLDIPPQLHFRALREVVKAERVAVLFNPEKTGPVVREAEAAAHREGIELVPIPVSGPAELEQALEKVDGSFDALWSVADVSVLSRGVIQRVLLHTLDRKIPFMGLSEQYVRAGALLALSTSYEENGRQTARQVRRVLEGRAPGALPVTISREVEVVFNPTIAERLRIRPSAQLSLRMRPIR